MYCASGHTSSVRWLECSRLFTNHWLLLAVLLFITFSNAFYLKTFSYFNSFFYSKFVPNAPISNIPALSQIMAWCLPLDLPEPMITEFTNTYILCQASLNKLNESQLKSHYLLHMKCSVMTMYYLSTLQAIKYCGFWDVSTSCNLFFKLSVSAVAWHFIYFLWFPFRAHWKCPDWDKAGLSEAPVLSCTCEGLAVWHW